MTKTHPLLTQKPTILPDPFEWIFIPGGQLRLHYPPYKLVEVHIVNVESFYIAKYPITNAQYAVYVNDTGHQPEHLKFWQDSQFNQPHQPVIDLKWQEAILFCNWLSEKTSLPITLPTDAQWQRAAQGDDNRKYPWGNNWDSAYCNTEANGINHTTPVTRYPEGASPYGVIDMAGNVCEWCLTDAKTGMNSVDFAVNETSRMPEAHLSEERIFKGSHFNTSTYSVDITKYGATPIAWSYLTGIRLVTSVKSC